MTKAFLTEELFPTDSRPLLTESQSGFLYLKGTFMEGEIQNQNGRIYPREEIAQAVQSLSERIAQKGPVPGELDHPEGLNINFDRIRHAITEIRMEGNNGVGTMRVMNAGMGLIVKGAVEMGVRVGVSTRGSGNVGGNGRVTDFDIITIDAVINPRAPNAVPKATFAESLMRNQHGREAIRLAQWVHDDASAQKHLRRTLTKFFSDISAEVTRRK